MWWVAPLGLIIGITLGALGGGGAILTVPVLVYLMGQPPHAATAGSLIIVGLSAIVGMIPHHRARRVRFAEGFLFGGLGILGSVAGSAASVSVPPTVLMSMFAVLMYAVAILMTRKRRAAAKDRRTHAAAGTTPPEAAPLSWSAVRRDRGALLRVVLAATGVGLLTGFFGVGGGFAVVPALVLALGFSMPTAVGTSLLVITLNSATALASRLGGGVEIDWPLILTFSLFGAAGSLLGGRIAQRANPNTLSLAFTLLLVAVGSYVAVVNVPALF
ncbi:MAG: sulfite exporter TauE/SafE family protein [Austwickia sp.]|jgi:uncharacterized protein|nr:sulfite exporter TauE/SafE family protein [Austwickia sp.]MBK8437568.1 sulfite exporter TauE/SafE family protein [Austwickia sp.]MBK9102834.1 sulfite exporter TauE/SafE family protein [Austwickia sp.]